MKTIYLIRHGNAYNEKWEQTSESKLNESGSKQVEALAERFKNFKVDEIYCSTMERAKETCLGFMKYHSDITPEFTDELREVLPQYFLHEEDKLAYALDKFDMLKEEVLNSFKKIVERSKDGNIFLFTHGNFIRFIVLGLLHGEVQGLINMDISFASVSVVKIKENGKMELVLLDDCSHTKGLSYGCDWL